MKLTISKSNERLVVNLPDEAVAQLGWARGDVLTAEVVDGGLRIERIQSFHDRAMEIARRGMVKYRQAFEALAKT